MEKRRHRRLAVEFDLCCRRIGNSAVLTHRGRAINASSSGLYFSTNTDGFTSGTMLEVELSIPPKSGRLERPGRILALGKVVRAERISRRTEQTESFEDCYGIALEFCRTPRLTT